MTPDLTRYILARLEQAPSTILTGAHLVATVNRTLVRKVWIGVDGDRPLLARTGCASMHELRRALRALHEVGMLTSWNWVPMRRLTGRGLYEVVVELDWRQWRWTTPRTLDLPTTLDIMQRGDAVGLDAITHLVERLVRHHEAGGKPYPYAEIEDWREQLEVLVGVTSDQAVRTLSWALSHDPWTTHLLSPDAGAVLARNWTYLSTQAELAQLMEP